MNILEVCGAIILNHKSDSECHCDMEGSSGGDLIDGGWLIYNLFSMTKAAIIGSIFI
jgi:hypothetical protein